MCLTSIAGVQFDSVRRFRAILLLRTTCMRLCRNGVASCMAAQQTKNQNQLEYFQHSRRSVVFRFYSNKQTNKQTKKYTIKYVKKQINKYNYQSKMNIVPVFFIHVQCFLMCILFYFSFIWLHVYALAFNFMVHCGSAFKLGTLGLPYHCTPPVCVPDVFGALAV